LRATISDPIPTIATFALITIGVPICFFSFARAEFH